jgi:hypothetical protein
LCRSRARGLGPSRATACPGRRPTSLRHRFTSATRGIGARSEPVGDDIWAALAWCTGILIAAYAFAMVVYRRNIA